MKELKIKQEFRDLIPPLTQEEKAGLEENILLWGCRDSIKTWDGYIIDGHHRHKICTGRELSFKQESFDSELRDEIAVKRWMIKNQFDRRNLSIETRLELAFKDEELEQCQAELRMKAGGHECKGSVNHPSNLVYEGHESGRTLEKIGRRAGCSHQTAFHYKKIKEAGLVAELSKGKSIKKVYREIQKQEREQTLQTMDFPEGRYRVIYADPPWDYGSSPTCKNTATPDLKYPVMSLKDICALPVADFTDETAVLFLWTTTYHIFQAKDVLDAWGFTYKAQFIWDKIKHNMGCYNSIRHEILLVATKGSSTPDEQKLFDSVQSIERTEHSAKPEEFRHIIDTLYKYGNKVELFARKKIEGWDVYGNEAI